MRVPEVVLNCTQYSQDWRGRRGDQRKKKKKRKKGKKSKNKIKTRSWYSWYNRIPSHRNLFNSFIISGISGEYRHFRSPLEFFHQPVKKGEKKKINPERKRDMTLQQPSISRNRRSVQPRAYDLCQGCFGPEVNPGSHHRLPLDLVASHSLWMVYDILRVHLQSDFVLNFLFFPSISNSTGIPNPLFPKPRYTIAIWLEHSECT